MEGKLYIVGVGPGHHDHMTFRAKEVIEESDTIVGYTTCLLYTSPSPRDGLLSRMPSSA